MTHVWEPRPSDYAGYWPGEDGLIPVGIGQNRDSDALEQSNFEAARERLEGLAAHLDPADEPDGGYVQVHGANHWACGWVETLWVADVQPLVLEVADIRSALEDYPVLDEEDFCRREHEDLCETLDDAVRDAVRDFDIEYDIELDFDEALAHVQGQVSDEGQWSRGDEVSWATVAEWILDWGYTAIWDEAHREYDRLYPAHSPGQLPLWVLG